MSFVLVSLVAGCLNKLEIFFFVDKLVPICTQDMAASHHSFMFRYESIVFHKVVFLLLTLKFANSAFMILRYTVEYWEFKQS